MSSLVVEVAKVHKIVKHPNADKLSIVTINSESGWNCIVGLDQYAIGDKVVFVPPDCIIPLESIEKYNLEYLKHNGRTGTIKLRGIVSQGLILDLPEGKWKVGDDCASVFGITKYEPPEPNFAVRGSRQVSKKKLNPAFDKYTEIENIKNYNDVFKVGDLVVVTEKIHGANSRFGNLEIQTNKNNPFLYRLQKWFEKKILGKTHEFIYGSHNVQISFHTSRKSFYSEDVWGKVAQRYDLADKIPEDTIIYGEVYGDGIQDLTYGLKNDIDLIVFDVKQNGRYLNINDAHFISETLGLNFVPFIYCGKFYDGIVEDFTSGDSVLCPGQIREGVVIRAFDEDNDLKIGRKVLKSINADYLARKDRTEFK
jgi:RNA ligase (TIGR02306 family)